MISLIYAVSMNGVIGSNGKLPWNIPADLKRFRKLTEGNTVVMGRKTFESIGKPLPNRHNVVFSNQKSWLVEGAQCTNCIDLIVNPEKYPHNKYYEHLKKEIFIIGGAQIYKLFANYADRLYETRILETFEGDTYLPYINHTQFERTSTEELIHKNINYINYIYDRR